MSVVQRTNTSILKLFEEHLLQTHRPMHRKTKSPACTWYTLRTITPPRKRRTWWGAEETEDRTHTDGARPNKGASSFLPKR